MADELATARTPVDQRRDGPGESRIDPDDPAAPVYQLLTELRSPLTLRDLMIRPVRTGYIGQGQPLDPAELPPSAARLYPEIVVAEVLVPSAAGPARVAVGGDSAGGDSAGGNFAAALPLKARDEGVPLPDAAVLLCLIIEFFAEQHESFERLAPLGSSTTRRSSASSAAPTPSTTGTGRTRT